MRDHSEPSGPQELAAQGTAKGLMAMERLLTEPFDASHQQTLVQLGVLRRIETAKNACRLTRDLNLHRRAKGNQSDLRDGVHKLQVPRVSMRERKRGTAVTHVCITRRQARDDKKIAK